MLTVPVLARWMGRTSQDSRNLAGSVLADEKQRRLVDHVRAEVVVGDRRAGGNWGVVAPDATCYRESPHGLGVAS
jgi:hypothetical protein